MLFISDSASSISCIRDIFYEIICWKVPGSQVFGDQNPVPRPGFSSSALTVEFIHCLLIGARTAHISSIKGTSSRVKFHAATPLPPIYPSDPAQITLQTCNYAMLVLSWPYAYLLSYFGGKSFTPTHLKCLELLTKGMRNLQENLCSS